MESLFSLEIIVNHVKLKTKSDSNTGLSSDVCCLFPCVAFRLLDYPTIAINLLDNHDARQIKASFANSTESAARIKNLPCFASLSDKHGRFVFAKGKSCLFRADLQSLKGHLRHTPMYLMLLDTFFTPHKLVGTTAVPLANLMGDMAAEVEANGEEENDTPCMKMTHGVFEVKNLMGDEIGFVSFAVRVTSYGAGLLNHIEKTTAESLQRQMRLKAKKAAKPKAQETLEEKGSDEGQTRESFYYLKKPSCQTVAVNTSFVGNDVVNISNAMIQTMKIDYKDVEVQISCDDNGQKQSKSQVTKSPKPKESKQEEKPKRQEVERLEPQSVFKITRVQEDPMNDQFCPPVLYFNSEIPNAEGCTTSVQEIMEKKEFLEKRIEYLKCALKDNEDISYETASDLNSASEISSMLEWIIPDKTNSTKMKSNFDLSQVPLLKCLFDEMNVLKELLDKQVHQEVPTRTKKSSHKAESPRATRESLSNLSNTAEQHIPIDHKTQTIYHAKPVGILRTTNRKLLKSGFKTKEQMVDSVNRLTNPRDNKKPSVKPRSNQQHLEQEYEHDEIPVGPFSNNSEMRIEKKKTPLKYRTTRAQEMRIAASRKQHYDQSHDDKESTKNNLIRSIKSNIDTLNESLKNKSNAETGLSYYEQSRNLDKVMFETIDSTVRNRTFRQNDTLMSKNLDKVMFETIDSTVRNRTFRQNDTLMSKNLDKVMFETIDSTARDRTFRQNDTLMSKNLDKVMFETIDDTVRDSFQLQSKHNMTSKSQMNQSNYSLLNKVDMDSTNDITVHNPHVNYEHKYNHYLQPNNAVINESDGDDVFYETATQQQQQQPKVVQFGRTYVLNTTNPTSDDSTTNAKNNSNNNNSNNAEMVESRDYSDDHEKSYSSSTHSTHTSDRTTPRSSANNKYDIKSYDSTLANTDKIPSTQPESNKYSHSKEDYFENDDSYNEIEYLGMTGGYDDEKEPDNILVQSRHSSNYNSRSFVTDSLSNTKDSLQTKSSRSYRH